MRLDALQTKFVEEFLYGDTHMVLTGRAGTGKSTALCAAVKAAQAARMKVLVMAPTAMAASIHRDAGLESGTIHHALNWNPAKVPLSRKLLSACGVNIQWDAKPDRNRILVVDEASMVGLWLFEILACGIDGRPFGGRRVVLVGDWAQLPPVVGGEEAGLAAMPELRRRFGPPDGCALFHRLFSARPPVAVVLEETHRANSEWFAKLNRLRDIEGPATLADLGMNFKSESGDGIHLCFRRAVAHQRNAERMASLPGRMHRIALRDGEMVLREGCKVIVTSNRAGDRYINGSRAVFAGTDASGRVLLDDGVPISMLADGNWSRSSGGNYEGDHQGGMKKAAWLRRVFGGVLEKDAVKWLLEIGQDQSQAAKFGDGRTTFQPYWPILPGYAITVHKAQGMGLSSAIIEPDIFWRIAPARLPYVALSRVSDEADISLSDRSITGMPLRPDPAYPPIINRLKTWAQAPKE